MPLSVLTYLNMPFINEAVSESISSCQYNIIIESVLQIGFASCCYGYTVKVGVNVLEFVHFVL